MNRERIRYYILFICFKMDYFFEYEEEHLQEDGLSMTV